MMLLWKIRYLDRASKEFKDRDLYLDTKTLDPVTRAAVELIFQSKSFETERDIFRYRHYFKEYEPGTHPDDPNKWDSFGTVGPSEYFEDETGKEITLQEIGPILTGSPTTRLIPSGAKQHDIDFMLAPHSPIPIDVVALNSEEVRLIGYFARDLKELRDSAFMKDGPGKISATGSFALSASSNHKLETAVTDEEIRSFVTIFRRLYMTGNHDPASFSKIIPIFVKALGDNPYGSWVAGGANEYKSHLESVSDFRPFLQPGVCTFTTKRLIDVFLYTQYAHQPNEVRQRQFCECLHQVYGNRPFLTWMFLTEIWKCSLKIISVGKIITGWFQRYCEYHQISPDVLMSLRDDHAGIGAGEKEENRRIRIFNEKVEQLAIALWNNDGRPQGGPSQFIGWAREQLSSELQG